MAVEIAKGSDLSVGCHARLFAYDERNQLEG